MDSTRLGQLAVSYALIDEGQLERCLEVQETRTPPQHLGEVLVSEGLINESTLRRLLSAQRKEVERTGVGPRFLRTELAERLAPGASLDDFLQALEELEGEEVHLAAGARPSARVHGALFPLRPEPVSAEEAESIASQACGLLAGDRSARVVIAPPDRDRYRANLFRQRQGVSLVLCRVANRLPALDALGLPKVVEEIVRLRSGLVLVTGPRASGKTTTLAALIEGMNSERRCHVVCLEETIEFVHESHHSLVTQIQVVPGPGAWEGALVEALRLDPDVIVVGDLDSPSRLATALSAAETGHLVLGTLPTNRVEQTLSSLIHGAGVERQNQVSTSLADLLRFVISQQLIPSLAGERLVLATEVLRNTPAIANMIREQRFHQLNNVLQTSREMGMQTLDEALFQLARAEHISAGEALSRAEDPQRLFQRLSAAGGKPQ